MLNKAPSVNNRDNVYIHAQTAVAIINAIGEIQYINNTFAHLNSCSFDEIKGKNLRTLSPYFQSEGNFLEIWNTISSGNSWKKEFHFIGREGFCRRETMQLNPIVDENGEIVNFIFESTVHPEKRDDDFVCHRRAKVFEELEKLSKTGGWEYDVRKQELYMTNMLYEILALPKSDAQTLIEQALNMFDESDAIKNAYSKLLEGGEEYDLTLWLTNAQGVRKCTRTKAKAIFEEGKIIKVYGSVKDVTEEMLAENKLKSSQSKLLGIANSFEDIIFTLDYKGTVVDLYGGLFNTVNRKDYLNKSAAEIYGKDADIHIQSINKVKKGESVSYQFSIFEEGEIMHFQTNLTPITDGILGVCRNITQEMIYQEELKKTKEHLNYALSATQAGSWDWHIPSGNTEISTRCADILDYALSDLVPFNFDKWMNLLHPIDIPIALKELYSHLENHSKFFDVKSRMRNKKGEFIWIWLRGQVVQWTDDGKPIRVVGTIQDINDWKNAEEALKLSEKRYRDLFTKSSDPIILLKDNEFIDCNNALIQQLGFKSKDEVLGKNPIQISPEYQDNNKSSREWYRELIEQLKSKESIKFEWNLKHVNSTIIPFEIMITTINDENGQELIYVVLRDISVRKKSQKLLLDSLKEKETLLAEIHHRVKNNLAVISGLMQLQQMNTNNAHDAELLSKSISRIKSMAIVHEQLYKSENFSSVSLSDNIRTIAQSIYDISVNENSPNINLNMQLKDVMININQAFSVGLLLNEILTNAFKYAFVGRKEGEIKIILEECDQYMHLVVADNGIGINNDKDRNSTYTLGHTLIDTFIKQLDADCKIESHFGTTYTIKFRKVNKRGSVAYNLSIAG